MKQFLLSVLFTITCCAVPCIQSSENQTTYALTAQLPKISTQLSNSLELSLPGLKAYYKGFKIDLSKGLAILPEITRQTYFSFVITPEVDLCCSEQDNSVKYLKRSKTAPILWFDATLRLAVVQEGEKKLEEPWYYWDIQKRASEELPERLPEQAIIILIDPRIISTIQTTKQESVGTIFLPSIVFSQELTVNELENALTFAAISSIDLDTVHTPANEIFTKARVRDIARAAALTE